MAKLVPFTDASGCLHPASVWFPARVMIDHPSLGARVVFLGWHDLAALLAGRPPIPGAERVYTVTGADYLAVAAELLGPVSVACYQLAADDPLFAEAVDIELPG